MSLTLLALASSALAVPSVDGDLVVIAPPADVRLDALTSDTEAYFFTEAEAVTLSADLKVNVAGPGTFDSPADAAGLVTIPAGTQVTSYMVHTDATGPFAEFFGSITFEESVGGFIILSDELDASDAPVGAGSTIYPTGDRLRGLGLAPDNDIITVSGDLRTLTIDLTTTTSVDQLRIITINAASDADGDGIPDVSDNCPADFNPGQEDWDANGIGDACDDFDGDGIVDAIDNCPIDPNPGQGDLDLDGVGNTCDQCPGFNDANDADGDGIPDGCDECDGTGPDRDGDGLPDLCDPLTLDFFTPQEVLMENDWQVSSAAPGAQVVIVASGTPGSLEIPGCPGEFLPFTRAKAFDSQTTDASGGASGSIFVPRAMAGREGYVVAIDRGSCEVSNILNVSFPDIP